MKTTRAGTKKKVAGNLRRHSELMAAFIADGLSKDEASRRALEMMKYNPRPPKR